MPELEGEADVRRQHSGEALQALEVQMEVRLELKEDRAELVAQGACRVDDQVDRFRRDRERLDVGDVAAGLDRKEEARRRLLSPGDESLRWRLAVEGVVERHRVEVLGVVSKVLARR